MTATSIWNMDANYRNVLNRAMTNSKQNVETKTFHFLGVTYQIGDEATGTWSHINQSWTFTPEQVLQVKRYISEHGMGNVKEPNALGRFGIAFSECKR